MRPVAFGKLLLQIPIAAILVSGQYLIESSSFGQGDKYCTKPIAPRGNPANTLLEFHQIDWPFPTGTFLVMARISHSLYVERSAKRHLPAGA